MIDRTSSSLSPIDAQAQIFKALTHPARIAILNILRDGEQCVCHIEACLGFRQAYISQQLAVLRDIGLIQDRRDGWNVIYSVSRPEIFAVLDVVEEITGQAADHSASAGTECSCPYCSARNKTKLTKE